MKKRIALALVFAAMLSLCACGAGKEPSSPTMSKEKVYDTFGREVNLDAPTTYPEGDLTDDTPRECGDWTYSIRSDGTAVVIGYKNGELLPEGAETRFPSELDGIPVTAIGHDVLGEGSRNGTIIVPEGVTDLLDGAFVGIFESKIILPSTLKTIGSQAFDHTRNLKELIVPDSVEVIGREAFAYCGLSEPVFPASCTEIARQEFFNSLNFTELVIPEGIVSIGDDAFAECRNVTSITLPSTLEVIGAGAFAALPGLTEVIIPEGVTSIDMRAFVGCENLARVVIPESVLYMGDEIFLDCPNVEITVVPESYAELYCEMFDLPCVLAK